MTSSQFIQSLQRRPLLADGGMGTQLIAAGMTTADSAVAWNRDRPDVVKAVHRAYAEAGCRLLTTNTFQGTRTALAMHGLADDAAALNSAAAKLAREVADQQNSTHADPGERVYVAADVGPFGGFLEPLGETTADELRDILTAQLGALKAGGADVALIETMSDPSEAVVAVEAAGRLADWPIVTTFAFEKREGETTTFSTMMGSSPAHVVKTMIDAGADVVGANCGTALTLDDYARLAEALVSAAGDVPVIVQPNAGAPRDENGRSVYDATADDMAAAATALLNAGVRIVGGCCGTEPKHLAAMAGAMKGANR